MLYAYLDDVHLMMVAGNTEEAISGVDDLMDYIVGCDELGGKRKMLDSAIELRNVLKEES
jgi:hypothetical protein